MNGLEHLEELLKDFDIQGELMSMEEIDGIYKLGERHEPGPTPKEGMVEVRYQVRIMPADFATECTQKRNTPLTFELNSGQVVEGFNRAVKTLGVGDKALFAVPPHLAYGKKGKLGIIPPNSWILYDIELVDTYQPANTPKLLISDAKKVKDEGNKMFKSYDISGAMQAYNIAIEKLENLETESQQQTNDVKDILIACHANMAAAYLNLKHWDDAIDSCTKVLDLDPSHIKAAYRIGQAYIAKGEFDLGIHFVKKGLEKQPNEPNLLKTLKDLKDQQALENARQKKTYAKMFN
ncbi:hypothetical protein K501DRAFT_285692 [Backusella circina FSU 941]|nr:hypothetical protein K501DRAFT_285692 [Backusella circina FSU 941]